VTVLFADVVGSTVLGESHDPERYRRVLARYFDRMRGIVVAHGGTVEKFIGDAVMAVFGLPTAHEDDALRAVRAAAQIQREVGAMADAATHGDIPLRWRVGVNTGEVSAGGPGEHTFATGDAVNLAARLQQAGGPGQILLGASTHELVRDAVTVERVPDLDVRGKRRPVTAHRLVEVAPGAAGRARRFDQPFVGRSEELALIDWVRRRAIATPSVQLATVYGAAGVGKTRLVATALDGTEVRTVWGRCLPYGDGVTYWPIVEALTAAVGLAQDDDEATTIAKLADPVGDRVDRATVAAVAATLGLTGDALAADPTGTLRTYLTALAGRDGLVVVVDDLHDAQPALLDLLGSLVRARPSPLLVVAIARPELLERHPTWGAGTPNALSITLEPLGQIETRTLLRAMLPGTIDPLLEGRLAVAGGGNPLFLEELVTVLRESGDLRLDAGGRWEIGDPLATLAVPVSIHGLLAARVDALAAGDRVLLGRAAVCGTEFTLPALAALTPEPERAALPAQLEALVDRDLLTPRRDGYAFRHHFARDAVYADLSRRRRAELHERFAAWLDAQASNPQRDEFVAYHLDRALSERTELDPDDPGLDALRTVAAERLDLAGHRAFARGAMTAAARHLGRAVELARPGRRRVELLASRGRALAETGAFEAADRDLTAASAAADELGDPELSADTRISALWVRSNLSLAGWVEEATRVAAAALAVFARTGNDRGLGRVWGLRGEIHYLLAEFAAAEEAARRAETHARAAGDATEARENAVAAAFALVPGPRPVTDILAACDELTARFAGDRSVEARLLQVRASASAMRGDVEVARVALAGAVERFEELGQGYWLASCATVEGHLARLAGDEAVAEDALRRGFDALDRLGDRAQAATVAAVLATVLPEERVDDIATLVAYATAHAHPDDLEARVRADLAAAHLALCRGDLAAAERAVAAAVHTAEPTDALVLQADADLACARVLQRLDRTDEAAAAAGRANDRYRRKGHTVGAGGATRSLGALGSAGPPAAAGADVG
jgi:class 3 adenylate cyclase